MGEGEEGSEEGDLDARRGVEGDGGGREEGFDRVDAGWAVQVTWAEGEPSQRGSGEEGRDGVRTE